MGGIGLSSDFGSIFELNYVVGCLGRSHEGSQNGRLRQLKGGLCISVLWPGHFDGRLEQHV